MRGFRYDLKNSPAASIRNVLERMNTLPFKERRLSLSVVLEYNSFAKVNAVPNDAMALARHSLNNGFALMGWPEDTPQNIAFARKEVWEILQMISPGQKYFTGNTEGFRGWFLY